MEQRNRYRVIGLTVLVVLSAATFLLLRQLTSTSAIESSGEMSLNAYGVGVECDGATSRSSGDVADPTKCKVPLDGSFTLSVSANTLPPDFVLGREDGTAEAQTCGDGIDNGGDTVADAADPDCLASDAKKPYMGFGTDIAYGDLTYKPTALAENEIVWPETGFPLRIAPGDVLRDGIMPDDRVIHADATALLPPFPESQFTGSIVEITLTCTPSSSVNEIVLVSYDLEDNTFGAGFKLQDGTNVPASRIGTRTLDLDGEGGQDRVLVPKPTSTPSIQDFNPPTPPPNEGDLIDYLIADVLTLSCGEKPEGDTPTPGGETPTNTPSGPTPTNTPSGPTPTSPPVGPTPTRGPTPTPCPGCLNMSLGATGSVICDDPLDPTICAVPYLPGRETASEFTITVSINVTPEGGYGGFAAEVFFGGLAYNRDTCANEVVWPDEFMCTQFVGPGDQRQLVSRTDIFPPLPGSSFAGRLVELDVYCPSEDQFKLTLTAAPSSDFGAAVVAPNGEPIYPVPAGPQQVDQDGDTIRENVNAADALLINCVLPHADVNRDGEVDSVDATIILQYLARLLPVAPDTGRMDANGDGAVNAVDVTLVLQLDAGLIPYIPRSAGASAGHVRRY